MSASKDEKEAICNEISAINRQSSIKTVRSRRDYRIRYRITGKEIVMQVKEGQKVIYSKYAGTEVKLDGEEYIIVRQNDILAIVE